MEEGWDMVRTKRLETDWQIWMEVVVGEIQVGQDDTKGTWDRNVEDDDRHISSHDGGGSDDLCDGGRHNDGPS